jgi:hypothetical protein
MVCLCMGSWDLPIRSPNMIAPLRGIVTKNWLGTPALIGASVTIPRLPLLRGSSDVVRARITKASIARQNIASVVAVVERVILAVPINGTWVELDHRAPRSRCGRRVSWTEAYRCKSSGSHQNRAYHHLASASVISQLIITMNIRSLASSLHCRPYRVSCLRFLCFDTFLIKGRSLTTPRKKSCRRHW